MSCWFCWTGPYIGPFQAQIQTNYITKCDTRWSICKGYLRSYKKSEQLPCDKQNPSNFRLFCNKRPWILKTSILGESQPKFVEENETIEIHVEFYIFRTDQEKFPNFWFWDSCFGICSNCRPEKWHGQHTNENYKTAKIDEKRLQWLLTTKKWHKSFT